MPFPLGTPPSYYCTTTTASRNNIFYVGGTAPAITLSQATPDAYEVFDYDGNVVSSGAVSGTSVTPTAPVGGWDPGWYRIYFTGPSSDATYGPSYGATNFVVLRNDSRFPPNATISGAGQGGGEARDMIMKGIMGMAPMRIQISDASAPTSGDNIATALVAVGYGNDYWADPTHGAYVEPDRPERQLMLQFPNRTFDRIEYIGGNPGFRVFIAGPTVNGANVYVQVEAGTSSGAKYTVRHPNSSTIVETYDNIANAAGLIAASASSAYIKVFGAGANPSPTGPTAIGTAFKSGVTTVVAALYPDVTRFEGPSNEPDLLSTSLPHAMMLFQDAVHDGHADAIAIGPSPVEISDNYMARWEAFLAAGGGDYCDEISFHAYNSQTNGDLNLGRHTIETFLAKLAEHGQDSKPLWCTESTHVMSSVYGVYHPRRSRVPLLQTLLWEQYGLPRERNHVWYDRQHGFWAYPAFLAHQDDPLGGGSFNPYAVLYRVLAEETFNMPHSQSLDFGNDTANAIFLGSVYQTPSGAGCCVLVSQSYMPSASVTLTVTGTSSPLTVVDGFGNETTQTISSGRATIPVKDIPTYVRLPTGVSVSVYSVNDWGASPPASISSESTTRQVGATTVSLLADDSYMTNYGLTEGFFVSSNTVPEAAKLLWSSTRTIGRVVIFCGPAWQNSSGLVDFDVDTTTDGTNWTTQETVTNATPTSFHFGTDGTNAGTTRETYWDEQWIFDVKLPGPVTCSGVRVNVRATSYGGEPDAAAVTAGGQGASTQRVAFEEIAVFEEDISIPRVTVTVRF